MAEEFQRKEMAPRQETVEMIEKVLQEWNIDPATVKDQAKDIWYLKQGSANFQIELFKFNKGPQGDVIPYKKMDHKAQQNQFLSLDSQYGPFYMPF